MCAGRSRHHGGPRSATILCGSGRHRIGSRCDRRDADAARRVSPRRPIWQSSSLRAATACDNLRESLAPRQILNDQFAQQHPRQALGRRGYDLRRFREAITVADRDQAVVGGVAPDVGPALVLDFNLPRWFVHRCPPFAISRFPLSRHTASLPRFDGLRGNMVAGCKNLSKSIDFNQTDR